MGNKMSCSDKGHHKRHQCLPLLDRFEGENSICLTLLLICFFTYGVSGSYRQQTWIEYMFSLSTWRIFSPSGVWPENASGSFTNVKGKAENENRCINAIEDRNWKYCIKNELLLAMHLNATEATYYNFVERLHPRFFHNFSLIFVVFGVNISRRILFFICAA